MSYEDPHIKTFPLNYDELSHYKEINSLIKQNLEQGSLPFNNEIPLPLDTNIITGRHFGDINQQKIELKAASIGSRNLWIFGADAQYLGLELKSVKPSEYQKAKKANKNFNCKPVVVQANIRERLFTGKGTNLKTNVAAEGLGLDCQCAYMIDQFTESSIQKVFSLTSLNRKLGNDLSPIKEHNSLIAKQIIKNINEYNSGNKEFEHKQKIKKNFALNFNRNTPGFAEAQKKYSNITKSFTPEQKTIFSFYYKHFIEQLSGEKQYQVSTEDKQKLNDAFSKLLKEAEENPQKSATITSTIFEAYTFTERLSHHNFSLEPVYTAEEAKEKMLQIQKITSPKAAQEREYLVSSIIDSDTKKKLHTKSYGMRIDEEQSR